jgi:hypothetical protein
LLVPITDTSAEAQAVQLQIQRAMTEEQRLLLALEMSLFARALAKARIQQEHPDWTESEVARELLRLDSCRIRCQRGWTGVSQVSPNPFARTLLVRYSFLNHV